MTNETTYAFTYEGCNKEQAQEVARESLLAASDTKYYDWSHETMDEIAVALVIDSRGGPESVTTRPALDWMALCCAGIGTQGPEELPMEDIDIGISDSLRLRQNLYVNLVGRSNWLAACDGLVAASK